MDEVRYVLAGDADPKQRERFQQVLESSFAVQMTAAHSFDELYATIKKQPEHYSLVLLSDSLPASLAKTWVGLETYVGILNFDFPHVDPVLVAAKKPRRLMGVFGQPPWIRFPCTNNELRQQLSPFLRNLRLPQVTIDGPAQLVEQVRDLVENRETNAGKVILAQLVSRFFDWKAVKVRQLAPGMSGARVFRVSEDGQAVRDFVLKLARASDRWKIELEAERCEKAPGGVQDKRVHVPKLCPAVHARGAPKVASFGAWCALCYDYLGGKDFEPLLDLHKILTAPAGELPNAAGGDIRRYRRDRLDKLLSWLSENWYMRDAIRKPREIWKVEDGPSRYYQDYPPYQLSGKYKAHILSFLTREDAELLGPRMFDDWMDRSKAVWDFVSLTDPKSRPIGLKGEFAALLAPSHGDLNSHNALIWEKHLDHPFLIDFPMYQARGHALQDFARLEVEVRFQLMDQQPATARDELPALGWTWSQIAVWKELDDHLQGTNWEEGISYQSERCCKENAELAFELTRDLRRKARAVQQQRLDNSPPPGDFLHEYRPPLLYHTLRAIGYTLPIFKRLLAVYSASEMLRLLS